MADENISGFDDLLQNLNDCGFGYKDKKAVVDAGAEVLKKKLYKNTPYDATRDEVHMGHYKYKGHVRDNITSKAYRQYIDGSTDVGYANGWADVIARFLNDGTESIPASNFMEKTADENHDDILAAQAAKAQEIVNRKGMK